MKCQLGIMSREIALHEGSLCPNEGTTECHGYILCERCNDNVLNGISLIEDAIMDQGEVN